MKEKKSSLFYNRGLMPEDYYVDEQGLTIYTETYHLKRGYCCRSRCKHCPYGPKLNKESKGKRRLM